MIVFKANEFADKLKDIAYNYKTLYVLGCFGAPMNATNKKRYTNNLAYNKKRAKIINSATDDTFGFDCICLIKGVLWGWNGDKTKNYGGATFASNGVPDKDADEMMNYCTGVSTNFSSIKVGEVVHMKGHIGVYVGDGFVVECTPKWGNNVQITYLGNIGKKDGYNSRKWTNHGKLEWIDYSDIKPSGKYVTGERVKSWQTIMNRVYKAGLIVDGSYGVLSQNCANKHQLYKKKLVGLRIRNDYVLWLQRRLKELGYKLEVDGSFWKETDAVVRQFQKDRGLKIDGYVGAKTVEELLK